MRTVRELAAAAKAAARVLAQAGAGEKNAALLAIAQDLRAGQADIRVLAEEYGQLAQSAPAERQQQQTLFSLVNSEAGRLQLSRRIEAARPAALRGKNGRGGSVESLELRMTGLYLRPCLEWLQALESVPGLRIESLNLRRTGQNQLDLDCDLSRPGGAP